MLGGIMEYEYVALTWQTHDRRADDCFMSDYHRLCDAGWEVSLDASFEPQRVGGACIMRRLKDEPPMWMKKEVEDIRYNVEKATVQRLVAKGLLRDRSNDDLKGEKMKEKDSCVPERCVEEKECIQLDVFPIYNAYLKKTCYDSEQALRLAFIEMQYRTGRTLTWPRK